MPTSKVNVTITINTKRADGTLTTVDRWDIISSAASTVRAAIEQYVEPKDRKKMLETAIRIVRSPVPTNAKIRSGRVEVTSQ